MAGSGEDAGLGTPGTRTDPEITEPDPDREVVDAGADAEVNDPRVRLPCDVETLLRARCQSCHAPSAIAIPLLTYADLTAASKTDASLTVAARSLQRMKDERQPMPPAPGANATSEEIATLQGWLEAGLPPGRCDDEPSNPPSTCTSGSYWTAFDSGSAGMMPGVACIKCHRQNPGFAPRFTVAGTVYPTAHEPDKCYGVPAAKGAAVIITDANGQEFAPIPVVSAGNFSAILSGLALPYRARVVVGTSERAMLTPQTDGDCNLCHTQSGTQGATGRVLVP